MKPHVIEIAPPNDVLFVGNSYTYYNNSLHSSVRALVHEAYGNSKEHYRFKALTLSGAYLSDLVAAVTSALTLRKWDVVVLQGHSSEALGRNLDILNAFSKSICELNNVIRSSNATPVLFMTWPFQDESDQMEYLARNYIELGNYIDALVVPVGLAFQFAKNCAPSIQIYADDKHHPTSAGTYLAACTFYAALYRRLPRLLRYSGNLDLKSAHVLQSAAWKTVQSFY